MEEIIYEVVIGAIILGVIMLVIVLFRSSVGTIKESVNEQAQLEDTADYDMIGVDNGIYSGSKIQEAYAYGEVAQIGFDVIVVNKGGTKRRVTDATNIAVEYPSSKRYKLKVDYLSKSYRKLATVGNTVNQTNHIAIDSADVCQRGDQGVAEIRFTFTEQ